MIITMGDTPRAQMARAQAMGIQQLLNVTFALRAILNVGTAMRATTAGRIPRNNNLVVLKLVEEHGDKQYDEKGWQRCAECSHYGSAHFPHLVAYKHAEVYGKHSRRRLRYGYRINKIFLCQPFFLVNDL